MKISSIITGLTAAGCILFFAAPAAAARPNPAGSITKAVKSIQQSVQTGFLKNGKSLLKADKKAANPPSRPSGSTDRVSSNTLESSASAPANAVPTSSHTVTFGVSCPGGGRFFYSGTAVTDQTTGSVSYNGVSIYNNCGSIHAYGVNATQASVIPSTGGYSVDTQGLVSATTSLCSGVYTNFGSSLSIDGTKNVATVEGTAALYCAQTLLESCTFPAGTPVNNQLTTFCTGSL